jgi:hypothetical protein
MIERCHAAKYRLALVARLHSHGILLETRQQHFEA